MKKQILVSTIILLSLFGTASAQYEEWTHISSLYILTTPEGANLPATASEENVPLLVRLSKATFNFSQAKLNGEDIRFSAEGKPLAYQIEEWDATNGTASLWVRIPVIKGNARQEIKLHWGKADAVSESNGQAVFNESNGYLSVFHMSNPVKDEVGTVEATDTGTTASAGVISKSRRFEPGKGINGGEKIATLPTGSSPHTTALWMKPEKANVTPIAWGNEKAQGKVVMQVASPPHIRMDCYFSDGNVNSTNSLPMAQWIYVVYTYKQGEARVYVNGLLCGENKARGGALNIESPARFYLGGWYGNFQFVGDIDEVRLSKVTRSADWIKLQYENQKPLQTLVGTLSQPGSRFEVAPSVLQIDEGGSATVTAQAGGAQKVYWVLKQDGAERVVATDQFSYTLDAGRMTGDTLCVLLFRAVYASEVKTKEIAVNIKEAIPEPLFTLKAPAVWNGRDTIAVVPMISNLAAMQAKGVGDVHTTWTVSGGAVIKEIAPDRLILKRSLYTGPITVTAEMTNGGVSKSATCAISVTEPKKDPWGLRVPGKDEKPEEGQFYARDDRNEGTLYYNGTLDQPADAVFLQLYANDKLIKTETQKPGAGNSYALTAKLKSGLIKYEVVFGTKKGRVETVLQRVGNLVCGDAYLIDGQSNALATDTGDKSPPETNDWIRSYAGPTGRGDATGWVRDRFSDGKHENLWCSPVWKGAGKTELGWWGMELAKRLVASQKVPICIIQAAVGGSRIDEHQRNEAQPIDLNTMYGRMLWRLENARLTHGIRAVIWHQGENDQGAAGPSGGYGWESYQQYFVEMSAAWKQDMPNIKHYYVFQIWPNSCSMGGGNGDMLREVQRTLPRLYSNMDVMSTLGIKPPGPCHFPLAGWSEFARLLQPLIERDFYGKAPTAIPTPPDLKQAKYTSRTRDAIALQFDQPVVWSEALVDQFYLDGEAGAVVSGAVSGNVLTLKLKEASKATKIQYIKEMNWSQDKQLLGVNNIAALTFCDVELQ